jgi:hypothetical protein
MKPMLFPPHVGCLRVAPLLPQPQKEKPPTPTGLSEVPGALGAMGASRRYASTKVKRHPFRAVPADRPKFSVTFCRRVPADADKTRGGRLIINSLHKRKRMTPREGCGGWGTRRGAIRPSLQSEKRHFRSDVGYRLPHTNVRLALLVDKRGASDMETLRLIAAASEKGEPNAHGIAWRLGRRGALRLTNKRKKSCVPNSR